MLACGRSPFAAVRDAELIVGQIGSIHQHVSQMNTRLFQLETARSLVYSQVAPSHSCLVTVNYGTSS